MDKMDPSVQAILPYLQHDHMLEQLHTWCAINSGTSNLTGLQHMCRVLKTAFQPLADDIETHTLPDFQTVNRQGILTHQATGDLLLIRKRPHLKRRVLLTGHMDTVFHHDHPFQTLTLIDSNIINGPGVADMKGGLIILLHALSAFEQFPLAKTLGWDILINADEEIGSPASRFFFQEIAPRYQAALTYEPSITPDGLLAKARKGSGKFTLVATGQSAHAGRAFHEGKNAICFLAEVVTAIHALNDQRDGVTINIGTFTGGDALNVVPALATTQMDIRISQPQDEAWVYQQLHDIIQRLQRPGYTLNLHGDFMRPVKSISPTTQQLFQRIKKQGELLSLRLEWQDSGGCCDGNNFAHLGLPVLDSLGVRGGLIHSNDEFILLDSLVERATLSTLLLLDLADHGLESLSSTQDESTT